MGLFGNRFKKIKRTDVVDTIITLEKQQEEMLEKVEARSKTCDELFIKGKNEKDKSLQMYYAKKISSLKKENSADAKRLQFIDSNLSAMQQLKGALDDRDFIANNSKMSLNQMLSKPAELKVFLSKINNEKMKREEQLAENLNTFDEINEEYIENEKIYGSDESAEDILAMFEMEKQLDDELGIKKEIIKEEKQEEKQEESEPSNENEEDGKVENEEENKKITE